MTAQPLHARVFVAVAIWALAAIDAPQASGAHFWLSAVDPLDENGQLASGSTPPATAAGVPQIAHGLSDTGGSLYVWARPDDGKTLELWSLRVLADNASVMRLTTSAVAPFNATVGTTGGADPRQLRRWDDVGEPAGKPGVTSNNAHLLDTMSGLMLGLGDLPGFTHRGVGLGAQGAGGAYPDPFYDAATDAWLLARIDYTLLGAEGASNVYLQVGSLGMYYVGEDGGLFAAKFGAVSDPPLVGVSGRQTNSLTPEAVVAVSAQPAEPSADFDGDGIVDGTDFLTWQRHVNLASGATHDQGDANWDHHVDGDDLNVWRQAMAAANPVESADFDGDGDRDGADFLTWQRGVGVTTGATPGQGDADGNGAVNGADLAIWRNQFGAATMAGSAPIPEPSTLGLAVLATSAWGAVERRRLRRPNRLRAGASTKVSVLAMLLVILGLNGQTARGALLAGWTFENSQPTTAGPHAAEEGLYAGSTSQAIGFHASPTAAYTAPVGNGSGRSFNSNNWSVGDYYQFQSSTAGFDSISLGWDQTRSTTGPADFTLQYSLTGVGAFTDLFNYTVPQTTWSGGAYNPASTMTFDASAIGAISDADAVYFRLASRVAGSSSNGTSRVDNFTINGINLAGQQVEWGNPAGGTFTTADNWLTGFAPRIQDRPLFNLPDAYAVSFAADATTAGLYAANGQVDLHLQGHSYMLSGEVDIRHEQTRLRLLGNYEQDSGKFLLNYGAELIVDGTFTKTGNGDFLVGTPNFTVGNPGSSSVEVGNAFIGGNGPVTLGQMIVHGDADIRHEGTVVHLLGNYLQDGGDFLLNYHAELIVDGTFTKTGNGDFLVGTPHFTVGNPGGSSVEAGDVFIGGNGPVILGQMIVHGNADIRHEGTVVHLLGDYQQDGGGFYLDYGAEFIVDGTFNKTGNGQFLIGTGNFTVGDEAASSVEAGNVFIGGNGAVTLGQMIVHGDADIRHQGTVVHLLGDYRQDGGSFHLNYDAELIVDGSFVLTGEVDLGAYSSMTTASARIGEDGQSSVDGTVGGAGTIWIANDFQLGSAIESVNNDVRLAFVNGAILDVDSPISVGAGAQLTGDSEVFAPHVFTERGGEVAGHLTVHANLTNRGQVAPGFSGALTVDGDYLQQADGSLQIEVSGADAAPEHGLLQITGAASLAGRLDAPLLHGYVPPLNAEIVLLQAASINGVFDALSSPNLGESGRGLEVLYGADEVRLKFVAPSSANQFQGTAASSNWTDAANWSAGAAPQSHHLVALENLAGAPQQVSVTQNAFVHHLSVAGGPHSLTLAVENGASFSALTGVDVGSGGVIELDGGRMVAEVLNVQTNGQMQIHNGGRFLARRESEAAAVISSAAGQPVPASVIVSGAGSEFRADGELVVGAAGHGELALSAGAYARTGAAYVGRQPGAVGAATLTGAGTRWGVEDSLFIGGSAVAAGGSGQVAIADQARLAVANRLHLWQGGELSLLDGTAIVTVGRGVPTSTPGTLQILRGGVLSGHGDVQANLVNGGALRPGSSPGIITINGDYTQTAAGLLEIEVGGLTPGTQHDQVRVGGVVTLGGRYEFPIINDFVPQAGDEIKFIETFGGGSVEPGTAPREAFAPGLEAANPDLAFDFDRIVATPGMGGNVKLVFVPKTEIAFDGAGLQNDWFSANPANDSNWDEDRNPAITDNTAVKNVLGVSQELRINSNDPNTGHAVANVRRLEVGELEGTSQAPMTVSVDSGFTLAATVGDVAIGHGGTVELNSGGTLSLASTQQVSVQAGGALIGAGLVSGSVTVGETAGASSAVVRLGLPDQGTASLTGTANLTIDGDYLQGAGGEIEFTVAGATQHDRLLVAGTAALGGVARIVVTDDMAVTPGMVIEAIVAGNLVAGAEFEDVITVGSSSVRFVPVYENAAATTLGMASMMNGATHFVGHPIGDLNLDGVGVGPGQPMTPESIAADAKALALAFVNPEGYYSTYLTKATTIGRVNDDDPFDFGDLRTFRELSGLTPGQMAAAIRAAQGAVPEPSAWALAAVAAGVVGAGRRRFKVVSGTC